MLKVAICSYSCVTEDKKTNIFNPIIRLLRRYNKYNIFIISNKEEINKYIDNQFFFDYVITFSFYSNNDKYKGNFRKEVNKLNYKNIIYVESSCTNDIINQPIQLRYSMNNIYFYKQENKLNKEYINFQKKRLRIQNINTNYKTTGSILLLLQNPHQYFLSMDYSEYEIYINNIIEKIREYTDTHIIIRYKPNSSYKINIKDPINNFIISSSTLDNDCNKSKYCIAHSTNAVLYCFINGLHMFSLSEFNITYEISDHDLSKLNNPTFFSYKQRNDFLEKVLNSSFTMRENFFINLIN